MDTSVWEYKHDHLDLKDKNLFIFVNMNKLYYHILDKTCPNYFHRISKLLEFGNFGELDTILWFICEYLHLL